MKTSLLEKNYTFDLEKAKSRVFDKKKLTASDKNEVVRKIKAELRRQNAVLVTHYYVDGFVQDLTLSTGGIVSDSLEMARFGKDHPAETLIVSGVKFMGETAKILSPEKRVLMPDIEATCSLDLGCPIDDFTQFCNANSERIVVVYANTSAAVKAIADWTVTSSCAINIVEKFAREKKPIIFAPDRHLGQYIRENTGADMLLWNGHCVVHDEFKAFELKEMKKQMNDEPLILVHPESPKPIVELADFVGSTSQILNFSIKSKAKKFIVATDGGLLHSMRKASQNKEFYEAPTAGSGATCKSCAYCPWMAMNSLDGILNSLEMGTDEIMVNQETITRAKVSLGRMLDFTQKNVPKN